MRLSFLVTVELDRTEGKFASKEDLGSQIVDALEEADPFELTGENEGTYETTVWEVTDITA